MQQTQLSLYFFNKQRMFEDTTMVKKFSRLQDEIRVTIGVWNLQGMLPPTNSTKIFMQSIIEGKQQGASPDLICISTQQCQRTIGASFFCQDKAQWQNALKQSSKGYKLVQSITMRALHTAILVRDQIANCYTTQKKQFLRAGTCNLLGNKGAIILVGNLLGQNFQFINCHLEAHQDQVPRRNEILIKISDSLVQKDYRNEVFLCGDLNYRIDMTHEQYYSYVKDKKNTDQVMQYSKMLQRDQLNQQYSLKQRFFTAFQQFPIKFPPTYKIGDTSQEYDKKRIPGWTDRIFHRKGRLRQHSYRCMYDLFGTDHRPVIGGFSLEVEETLSIFPEEYVVVKSRNNCALI